MMMAAFPDCVRKNKLPEAFGPKDVHSPTTAEERAKVLALIGARTIYRVAAQGGSIPGSPTFT